jgi:hypothetical protein
MPRAVSGTGDRRGSLHGDERENKQATGFLLPWLNTEASQVASVGKAVEASQFSESATRRAYDGRSSWARRVAHLLNLGCSAPAAFAHGGPHHGFALKSWSGYMLSFGS